MLAAFVLVLGRSAYSQSPAPPKVTVLEAQPVVVPSASQPTAASKTVPAHQLPANANMIQPVQAPAAQPVFSNTPVVVAMPQRPIGAAASSPSPVEHKVTPISPQHAATPVLSATPAVAIVPDQTVVAKAVTQEKGQKTETPKPVVAPN